MLKKNIQGKKLKLMRQQCCILIFPDSNQLNKCKKGSMNGVRRARKIDIFIFNSKLLKYGKHIFWVMCL